MKKIKLSKTEQIIAVVPEFCHGPGWSNQVVWVHIVDYATNQYRVEDIQPVEQSKEMLVLFKAGAAMLDALLSAVPVEKEK